METALYIAGFLAGCAVVVAGEAVLSQRKQFYTRRSGMAVSKCGRYLFDVWHDPIGGYHVSFKVNTADAVMETRFGFQHPHEVSRCIDLLVAEHFIEEDAECEGR